MPPRRRLGPLTLLLLGLCLASAAMIARGLTRDPALTADAAAVAPSNARPAATETAVPLAKLPPVPTIADLAETLERPLFRRDRRPPEPEVAPPIDVAEVEPARFGLIGVVLFDDRRIALVQPSNGGRVRRVVEGQRLDRWQVSKISARRIVLKLGDRREVIRLVDRARPKRAAAPEASPALEGMQKPAEGG